MSLTVDPNSISIQQQFDTPAIQSTQGQSNINATQATQDTPTVPENQPSKMTTAVSQNNAQTLQVTKTKDHPYLKDSLTMRNLNAKSDLQVKQSNQDFANRVVMDALKTKGFIDEEGQIVFKKLGLSSFAIKRLHLEGDFFINKTTGKVDFNISGFCNSKSMAAIKILEGVLAECRNNTDRFPENERPEIPIILYDLAGKPSPSDRAVLNNGGSVVYRTGEDGCCVRAAADPKREEVGISVTDYKGKHIDEGREQISFSTVFGDNRLPNYQEVFARKQDPGSVGEYARTQIMNAISNFLDLRNSVSLENPPPAMSKGVDEMSEGVDEKSNEISNEENPVITEEKVFDNQEQAGDKNSSKTYDLGSDVLKRFDNNEVVSGSPMININLGDGLKPLNPDLKVQSEDNIQLINVLSDLTDLLNTPNLDAIRAKLNDLATISLVNPKLNPLATVLNNLPLNLLSFSKGTIDDISGAISTILSENEETDPELLTSLSNLQNILSQLAGISSNIPSTNVNVPILRSLDELTALLSDPKNFNLEAINSKLNELGKIALNNPKLNPLATVLNNSPLNLLSFSKGTIDDISGAISTILSENEETDPELLTSLSNLQNILSQLAGISSNIPSTNVNVPILRSLDELTALLSDPKNFNLEAINSKLNELEKIALNNPELKPLVSALKLLLSNLKGPKIYLDENLISTIKSEGDKISDSEASINDLLNALENLKIQMNNTPETVKTPIAPTKAPVAPAKPKNLTFSERLDNALKGTSDVKELNLLFEPARMRSFMGFSPTNTSSENDSRFAVMQKYCQLADSLPAGAESDKAKRTLASMLHDNICNQGQRMSSQYVKQMPREWRVEIDQQYKNYINDKDYKGAFEFMKNTVEEIDTRVNRQNI